MKTQSVRYDFKKIKPKNTEPEAKLEKTKSGECREDRVREIWVPDGPFLEGPLLEGPVKEVRVREDQVLDIHLGFLKLNLVPMPSAIGWNGYPNPVQ